MPVKGCFPPNQPARHFDGLVLRQFRDKKSLSDSCQFPNFLQERKIGLLLLKHYPILGPAIQTFVDANLEHVSAKVVRDHILDKIIPVIIDAYDLEFPSVDDDELNNTPVQGFLLSCGLKSLSERAVLDIMHHLECTYELHQKSFYTNNHGKYVDHRIDYVWSYLHQLEPCFPLFVKLRSEEVEKMKTEERLNQELQGHTFTRDGTEYREFHVDCCLEFFDSLMSTPPDDQ
jgi:hypothetical protein